MIITARDRIRVLRSSRMESWPKEMKLAKLSLFPTKRLSGNFLHRTKSNSRRASDRPPQMVQEAHCTAKDFAARAAMVME